MIITWYKDMSNHGAQTIFSWPDHKMANGSYFGYDDDYKIRVKGLKILWITYE